MTAPNTGQRRKISIDGERYYLLVTQGGDGWTVEISADSDVPPHSRTRCIIETLVLTINETIREVAHAA